MAAPKKFAQELAKRIVNTRGVLAADRAEVRRVMTGIAFDAEPLGPDAIVGSQGRRNILLALQIAARDPQVWTALVAARAALGK